MFMLIGAGISISVISIVWRGWYVFLIYT